MKMNKLDDHSGECQQQSSCLESSQFFPEDHHTEQAYDQRFYIVAYTGLYYVSRIDSPYICAPVHGHHRSRSEQFKNSLPVGGKVTEYLLPRMP